MATSSPRTRPRREALSRERIVAAAIAILDAEGEAALTFRALTTRLATGAGAVYWHVANKQELLAAATTGVVDAAMSGVAAQPTPRETVRAVAGGVFDAIHAHPWVGTQLSLEPWQPAIMRIFEGLGAPLAALGVPAPARFDCASALLNVVLGLAGQYAAAVRLLPRGTDRAAQLDQVVARWDTLDAAEFPFVHEVAPQMRGHDDRAQFLAGIDLVLAGATAPRRRARVSGR